MTKEKILKLIKGLNRFYPDDLVVTSEEDETIVLNLLNEFAEQGTVKKLDNDMYLYIEPKKQKPAKNTATVEANEYEIYKRIESVSGKKLMSLSKQLKEEFPDFKVNYSTLIKIKRKYSPKAEVSSKKTIPTVKPIKKTIKFSLAASKYLESEECLNLKKSTFFTYKTYINNHLVPFFKDLTCKELTADVCKQFTTLKTEEGMTAGTINKLLIVLKKIAKTYDPDNFPDEAKKMTIEKEFYSDMRILSEEEINKLLKTCREVMPDYYPLLFTAISTGLTRGEILGLTWDRVDYENMQLKVDRSIYRGLFTHHKTPNSNRHVDMPEDLVNLLKDWQRFCPKTDIGFVFPNFSGEPQDPDNMIKRQFTPVVKAAKIREIRFSDLRDIYASLLIKQNLPISYVQIQLGHSSVNVTFERYKKLLNEKPKKLVSLLNSSLLNTD